MSFKDLFSTKTDPFLWSADLRSLQDRAPFGRGGMGDVYEATDLELGRIALKTIRADIASSPEMLSRFRKEVQLARKISGPHVCRIHELFVLTGDRNGSHSAFLTMEFLEGVTLADKLCRSGPLRGVMHRRYRSKYATGCKRSTKPDHPSRLEEPKHYARLT